MHANDEEGYKNGKDNFAAGLTLLASPLIECLTLRMGVFRQTGIRAGDRVLIISPKYIHAPVIWLGMIAAGAIFIGRAAYFTAEQQAFYVGHAEPKARLVYEGLEETAIAAVRFSEMKNVKVFTFDEDLKHGDRLFVHKLP